MVAAGLPLTDFYTRSSCNEEVRRSPFKVLSQCYRPSSLGRWQYLCHCNRMACRAEILLSNVALWVGELRMEQG